MTSAQSPFATPLIEFDEIDSTNQEALRRAASGESGPLWITAHRQLAGRGRSGRTWHSAPGNLAATLLLTPGCAPAALHQLSFVSALAVHDAVSALLPPSAPRLQLKWPNDVLAGTAKLAGILIESTLAGRIARAAIGIGINVAAAPALDDRATASLAGLGAAVTARDLLSALDRAMPIRLAQWSAGAGFAGTRSAWLARSVPIGSPVSIDTGQSVVEGTFRGIDETGALLIGTVSPDPSTFRRFSYGDVSLLPPRSN